MKAFTAAVLMSILIFAVIGCETIPQASNGPVKIEWYQLNSKAEVAEFCSADNLTSMQYLTSVYGPLFTFRKDADTAGCYRIVNGVCRIYTTKRGAEFGATHDVHERLDADLFATIGHEVVHCFE